MRRVYLFQHHTSGQRVDFHHICKSGRRPAIHEIVIFMTMPHKV